MKYTVLLQGFIYLIIKFLIIKSTHFQTFKLHCFSNNIYFLLHRIHKTPNFAPILPPPLGEGYRLTIIRYL